MRLIPISPDDWDPVTGKWLSTAVGGQRIPQPTGTDTAPPAPAPGPGGSTTPPPTTQQQMPGVSPWNETFDQPMPQIGSAPLPTLPQFKPPPAFAAPSLAEAMNDPGYQFRLKQGQDSLGAAAAAHGTLNDSGTLKAFQDYGQNAASQEYSNVYNREADTYNRNYQTQYRDPYQFDYQRGMDLFAPQMETWRAQNAQANTNYTNAYQHFLDDYTRWRDINVTIPNGLSQ